MKVFKFSFQIALFLCFFAFQSFSLTARSIVPVNDTWKAYKGAPNPAPTAVAYNDSAAGWSSVQLPHTFEYMPYDPEANYYKGIAYYRNHFFLPQTASGKRVFITFESAMNFAQVWCNGTKIGSHHYGWTPFTFEITNNVSFGATENILAVSADNTPSPSEPSTTSNFPNNEEPTDFIINSGLHRKVYITITDDLHIPDANGGGDDGGGIFVTYP